MLRQCFFIVDETSFGNILNYIVNTEKQLLKHQIPQCCHEKQLHVIIILIKCKCFTQNNKIHEINWIKTEIRNLKLSYTSKLIWQFITDTERNKVYLKENFRNRHEAKQSNFKRNIFITDTKQNKVYLKETFS